MGLKKDENFCIMQLSKNCKKKGGVIKEKDFYMATTKMFKGKKIHICKDCMHEYVYEDGIPNVEKFKDILRISDYPFFKSVWETSFNDKAMETIGAYFKNVYFNWKDKTWKDGDGVNMFTDVELGKQDFTTRNHNDTELAKTWGRGFSTDELHWLEDYYDVWKTKHDLTELPVQRLVRRICITELKIRIAEENGDNTDKLDKNLLDLMEKASLTPKNLKGTQENDSQRAWGLFIRDIEKYKPAEFFQDKTLYEDYDGILDYFNRFILRPMKNLLIGSRDFDKEFNIEEDDELVSFEEDGDNHE